MTAPDRPPGWSSIEDDRSRGSRELLLDAVDRLEDFLDKSSDLSDATLRALPGELAGLRPAMALFRNAGRLISRIVEQNQGSSRDNLMEALGDFRSTYLEAFDELEQHFNQSIRNRDTLLLFSRSGTILELLETTKHPPETVHVLESHPGDEGVDVANKIEAFTDVVFHYDLEAVALRSRVDAFYVGADAFDTDGTILNKVGTRFLAELLQNDAEVVVCTESLKLVQTLPDQDHPAAESPMGLTESLRRSHPLFERVPGDFIDRFVTERGVFGSTEDLLSACDPILEAQENTQEGFGG